MAGTPSASDSQPRWPRVYTPAGKLAALSAVVGIGGVLVWIAAVSVNAESRIDYDDGRSGRIVVLVLSALLLWGAAVAGRAVRKESSWTASFRAGLVAFVVAIGSCCATVLGLLVVALSMN